MDSGVPESLNVLVVDDDPAVRRLIGKIVASAGHEVSHAQDGRQALDSILRQPPDLIICDWEMPKLDGTELCREVRQHKLPKYVYIILVTGKSDSDDIVKGLAAGADDFVSKPVNRAVLLARIGAGARVIRMDQKLRRIAQDDALTGLMNRRTFHERFNEEWERAARHHLPLSCAMLDLDFFKRVNDTHGHPAGDAVIQTVAKILMDQCRPSDSVCRYGGEEFYAMLPETTEAGAAKWAERARVAIAEASIPIGDLSLQVTASLGVAERLADTTSPENLVELTDQAMAVAKQSGRNRVVRFSSLDDPMLDLPGNEKAAGPLDNISARDVMSTAILCPNQNDTVGQVANLFLQLRINSAPIVNDAGIMVGIVAETDLLTRTALGEGWDDSIRNVMRTDVVCYEENTPVKQVYQFLARVSVPRVVVVDQGRPTGVISRGTLLRWFRNWMATRRETDDHGSGWADGERERCKAGIVKTAEATEQRAAQLQKAIANEDCDFVPCVVGEATRLQSLVNDLLGQCRGSI